MSYRAVRVLFIYEHVLDGGPHGALMFTDPYGAEMLRVILTGMRFDSRRDGRVFVRDGLSDMTSVYFFHGADMELADVVMEKHG